MMSDLQSIYDKAYNAFVDQIYTNFGDQTQLSKRQCALDWSCDNGCLSITEWIFDTFPNIYEYDLDRMMRIACQEGHMQVVEYLASKCIDIDVIGDIVFGSSSTSAAIRRYLLDEYPDAIVHIKRYYVANNLRAYKKPVQIDFLVEITKDCDISFHRRTNFNGVTDIYIISTEHLDIFDTLAHNDCQDFHVYFANVDLARLFHVDMSKFLVDTIRFERLKQALISSKKSAAIRIAE